MENTNSLQYTTLRGKVEGSGTAVLYKAERILPAHGPSAHTT